MEKSEIEKEEKEEEMTGETEWKKK